MANRFAALALLLAAAFPLQAQTVRPDSAFLAQFRWRSIGPANMSGRVADIEANPLNTRVVYVAFATGGVWKTVNAGTTWEPVFDRTGAFAASEIAIAPSDTSVIWVGTGEVNSRNSISPGTGVFKSTDGGRTWQHMGLRETQFIGRIVVHPTNPDIVWVAALGRAWGPSRERGLYKTTDGGRTWRLVKFISDRAGFVDLAVNPADPNLLLAGSWERQRGPYFLRSGGPGSGLWRSTDGGESWARVTSGLPTTTLGRIGVAFATRDPQIAYAIVEADSNPNPASLRRGFVPDPTHRQRLQSGLFRSTDGGLTWSRMNWENNRPFYYSQVRVDPRNDDRVYWLSTQLRYSNDGGSTYRTVGQGIHVDYHALWIDPNDPDHYIVGQDGGIAQTFDRGRTYDAILQMAVGQFYAVGLDMQRPFWVCGGLQDNGTWCGPTISPRGTIRNEDWTNVGGGDGFYAAIDPTDPDIVYYESQGGNVQRRDLRTWQSRNIRPGAAIQLLRDSIILAGGDTTLNLSAAQQRIVDSLMARYVRDTTTMNRNRFNWQTPFLISPHNPRTLYLGGQRVWKSVNRGDTWVPLSDDLSTRDSSRVVLSMRRTGGITRDTTNAETHGTITTLAESPVRPGILWAGTDDGNVWLSRNDGGAWENLTGRFPGVPPRTWVSRVEPSSFDTGTVYVAFDGHRDDNFRPYVFVSNDFGRTFRSLSATLPESEYVHVIREDPRRRGLLFLGTEVTAYASTDGGESWRRFAEGLPPAPVHDLKIHPRDRVLVAATHGRSIYVVDIGPLEEATDSILAAPAHVFAIEPALLYTPRAAGGGVGARGHKHFQANNPPFGARIPVRIVGAPPLIARGPAPAPAPDTAAAAPADPLAALLAPSGEEGEGSGPFGAFGGGGGGGGGGLLATLLRGGQRPRGDTVRVVITDAAGDTVRTLYTNARPSALRWITWDLRRERQALSPAQRHDSTVTARRVEFLRDSLRTALRDTARATRGLPLRDPQPREPGTWNNPLLMSIQASLGGGFGGAFGGGGGQGPLVVPGIYTVSIRLNGVEHRRTLQVERPSGTSALAGGWQ
jgi:photosystem II stability/assembly factor-like uncharacterized protein